MEYKNKFREVDRLKILSAGQRSLRKDEGKKALAYLKDERGFTDDVIDRFEFGYCPEYINHQLKGRIIHPIYDAYGNLLAIASRHLNKGSSHRFWHESFDKSSHLFGLNFAKYNIAKSGKVIIVEGEYDVIYLHAKGFSMSVGVCGKSFSLLQASLLSRYCNEVFFVFDGDEAGRLGTIKVKKFYKKHNLDIYGIKYFYVTLPKDKDPDEFVQESGTVAFINILKESREAAELDLE